MVFCPFAMFQHRTTKKCFFFTNERPNLESNKSLTATEKKQWYVRIHDESTVFFSNVNERFQ